jgi:3-oxoacid CoA-transferase
LDNCTILTLSPLSLPLLPSPLLFLQCVFDIDRKAGKMTLTELAPGITLEEVKEKTGATFDIAENFPQTQE